MFNRRLAAILFTTALFGQDLQSPEAKERIKAVRALKDGGSTAISSLTPLLSDPDREVRLETFAASSRSARSIASILWSQPLGTTTRRFRFARRTVW